MIRTPEGIDRGQALYQMYPGAIKDLVVSRKNMWFESHKYRSLKNLCVSIDNYIDGKSAVANPAISDITPQIVRRGYNEYLALFYKFLETDPLFSGKTGSAMRDSAITELLTKNIDKTSYRERCLPWSIDHIVRYGTFVTYTYASNDYESGGLMTVKDPEAYGTDTYIQQVNGGSQAAVSVPIHPLNIIIDPKSNFMQAPDYVGVLSDICVSGIMRLANNPVYIAENLKKVIADCKHGMPDKHWFNGDSKGVKDFSRGHASLANMYLKLPFEGNEGDDNIYSVELVGNEIIRIEQNQLDNNTIPIAIGRINPRQYEWYGNSPLVDKIGLQNLQYWIMNTTVDAVAKANDRIILHRKGELPWSEIQSRHQRGGLVEYSGQESDLSKLMFSPELPKAQISDNEWLMQLTRREDQDSSAMPNFNPQAAGGPTNKTLGGAQMMASIGEMKMSKHITDMVVGLKDVAKQQLALLINLMPDNVPEKALIIQDKNVCVKTSNVFNYMREVIDAKNRLTDVINFKSTQIPELQSFNMAQLAKDWIRNSVKKEDIDDYYDENKQPEQQAMPVTQVQDGAM